MSGSVCFGVSLITPISIQVADRIKKTFESVIMSQKILSYTTTDTHLFVLTDHSVVAARLDALRDPPLVASLDISSPDVFRFVSSSITYPIARVVQSTVENKRFQKRHYVAKEEDGEEEKRLEKKHFPAKEEGVEDQKRLEKRHYAAKEEGVEEEKRLEKRHYTAEGQAVEAKKQKLVDEVVSPPSPVPSHPLLLASTHSRVFIVDQRAEEGPKMYRIFDASSPPSAQSPLLLQLPEKMGKIKQLEGGADHMLALTEAGRVWAMGTGSHGELGTGGVCSSPQEFLECDFPEGVIVEEIAAGAWHSVAMTVEKDAYVWGWNREEQLGEDKEKCEYAPSPLNLDAVISIEASECTTVITIKAADDDEPYKVEYGSKLIKDNDK